MPMCRDLYPDNWSDIAWAIKTAAGWDCVWCNRPCRRPGETDADLVQRVRRDAPQFAGELFDRITGGLWGADDVPRFGRFTLTVAHLDHIPANCSPDNLRALCAPCHGRYDLSQMAKKRRLKLERLGQLVIPFESVGGPAD